MMLDANPYTNLVINAIAIKAVLELKEPAMAKPNMAIDIASNPDYTKLRLLNLVKKYPTIGEPTITDTEYMLKM